MLYKHSHRIRRLRESGRRASAKVVDAHVQLTGGMSGVDLKDHPRSRWIAYRLELRVLPEGGEPFLATVHTRWYSVVGGLWTGADVEVLYETPHPRDVVVDYEAPVERWEAARRARVRAVRMGEAPAFDRDGWIALVREGEEAAETATDPEVRTEINGLVHRFDSGRITKGQYRARLAELTAHQAPDLST